MSDKKPSANLPSEIGAVIEQLAVKAAKADGAWIADYAEFEDTVISSIKVSRQHIKDEDGGVGQQASWPVLHAPDRAFERVWAA